MARDPETVDLRDRQIAGGRIRMACGSGLLAAELGSPRSTPSLLSSTVMSERGRLALNAGSSRTSARPTEHGYRAEPDECRIAFGFEVHTYRQMGQFDKAVPDFDQAIASRPEGRLGDCQPRRDLPRDRATTSGRWPTSTRPSSSTRSTPGRSAQRGQTYRQKGDYERALADFDRAIELDAERRLGDCPVAARPTARRATTSGRWPTSTRPSPSTREYPG